MLPDLESQEGLDVLREQGYGISEFASFKEFRQQAKTVELALKATSQAMEGLTGGEEQLCSDIAYFVLDSMMNTPKGFEFFQRFPRGEVGQFCRLAVESRVNDKAIPVVCPICPDYQGHYRLGDGVGSTAERVLSNMSTMLEFFAKRSMPIFINMHVADVEAFDELILRASNETARSFLEKTSRSTVAIQEKINGLRLEKVMVVSSMLEVFDQSGVNYDEFKRSNVEKIQSSERRKVKRTINALVEERVRLGDFDLIDSKHYEQMAAEELANYATYGDLVNGQAVILSPDTLSPIPAYNFLRNGRDLLFNPTIYLKSVKSNHASLW